MRLSAMLTGHLVMNLTSYLLSRDCGLAVPWVYLAVWSLHALLSKKASG